MTRSALVCGLLLAALVFVPRAGAQERIFPYCLQDNRAGTVTCAFTSMRQCLASRNSTNDTCTPNPQWSDRRR